MDKEERIAYLSKAVYQNSNFTYSGPKFLYKYRPFDKYSFDMLEKEYLYLCPASDLDDETECDTSINLTDIYELETNNLKRYCLEKIIQQIKPHCSDETYESIRNKIYSITLRNGIVRRHFLTDLAIEIQKEVPDQNIYPLINSIVNLPDKLDDPSMKPGLERLVKVAMNAKSAVGICSLTENNDIEYMWEKYAADYSGYCVEYDVSDYEELRDLFPVIYDAKRDKSIIMAIVCTFIGFLINRFSENQIMADTSQYLRLFVSKYPKWEYQNEWRIIGEGKGRIKAPKIKRIFIGKNASPENVAKLTAFCEEHNIEVVKNG